MAQRAHVPKFGNWENEDDVPYTVYFDKARQGRGGKMINPNDPQENPHMFSNIPSSDPAPAPAPPSRTKAQAEEPMGRGAARTKHDQRRASTEDGNYRQFAESPARSDNMNRRVSREDGNYRQFAESPARSDNMNRRASREDGNYRQFAESPARSDNMNRRASGDQSPYQQYGHGSNSGRPSRQSAGSEHNIERSPLHPHYQAKVRGGAGGSPALEGKNSYDSSHGTPGRSRMKPVTQADESPDRGAAVPRFGEWDENNPQSADNYTEIFQKVSKERITGPSNTPGANSSYYNNMHKQKADNDAKGCCFPFLRK